MSTTKKLIEQLEKLTNKKVVLKENSNYKFNDANTEIASQIETFLDPILRQTITNALTKAAQQENSPLRSAGSANIGLAVGWLVFDIVNKMK